MLVGLTASSLFSFPVATFVAASVLVLSATTHYFASSPTAEATCDHHHHSQTTDYGLLDTVGQAALRSLAVVVEPAMQLNSLELLSDGILVSPRFTGKAVLLLCIVYPGFFGLVGGLSLTRRELALPA